ncbi:MAG: nucleoside-diphosphate kinase [Candidatus Aenigmarchaeota archaeon]|nr:nucleoside-diphosphate kinase [Candidatus Aenigmarchaeota archaeon]
MADENPYTQRTLGLLKPETQKLGFGDEIKYRITRTGLVIVAEKRLVVPEETAMKLYDRDLETRHGPEVRRWLVEHITSGESVPMAVYGPDAARVLRRVAGENPDPLKCHPGTIRFDFAAACPIELAIKDQYSVRNIIHAADPHRAEYELGLFFTEEEMAFHPPEEWRYRFSGAVSLLFPEKPP